MAATRLSRQQLLAVLRRACDRAGNQLRWSELNGVSNSVLSDVLRGRREPTAKILAVLGFRKITTVEYERLPRTDEPARSARAKRT